MLRKFRRLFPVVLATFIFVLFLRIFCVFPCNNSTPTKEETASVQGKPNPKAKDDRNISATKNNGAGAKALVVPQKPVTIKATPAVPKHAHEEGPKFNPNRVNPFSLFRYYPLNVDLKQVVSDVRRGQTVNVKPINSHSFEYIIHNKHKCRNAKNIFLLILVKTRPDSFDVRTAIRQTWGNESMYSGFEVRTIFMIGSTTNASVQKKLSEEDNRHKDILQENFNDHYFNNTKKIIMGMKWVTAHCKNVRYVMFTDDDMMVIPSNVVKLLSSEQVLKMPRLYMGFVPLHPQPSRNKLGDKWYISEVDYPLDRFPNYATTGSLFMNLEMVRDFYVGFQYTKMINFDDVYVGIVAKKLGIEAIHNDFVYPNRKNYSRDMYKTMIACHGAFKPNELLQIWTQYRKDFRK